MSNSLAGLSNSRRLTQSSYRTATSETVRALQGVASDQDMADVWGVSSTTVCNTRNKNSDLSAMPLLKIGEQFGPTALNTVMALIGAKVVSIETVTLSPEQVAAIPCNVAATVPTLIRLLADGDASEDDIRQLDREGVIDCFAKLADMLSQRRDALRFRVVV